MWAAGPVYHGRFIGRVVKPIPKSRKGCLNKSHRSRTDPQLRKTSPVFCTGELPSSLLVLVSFTPHNFYPTVWCKFFFLLFSPLFIKWCFCLGDWAFLHSIEWWFCLKDFALCRWNPFPELFPYFRAFPEFRDPNFIQSHINCVIIRKFVIK